MYHFPLSCLFCFVCLVSEIDETEEDKPQSGHDGEDEGDPIQRYKLLLQDIEKKEENKKNKDMEMEITWGLGIKDKAEELIKKKLNEGGFTLVICS